MKIYREHIQLEQLDIFLCLECNLVWGYVNGSNFSSVCTRCGQKKKNISELRMLQKQLEETQQKLDETERATRTMNKSTENHKDIGFIVKYLYKIREQRLQLLHELREISAVNSRLSEIYVELMCIESSELSVIQLIEDAIQGKKLCAE